MNRERLRSVGRACLVALSCSSCGSAPHGSITSTLEIASNVAGHLGSRSIDILVHGSYGYGLIGGEGSVMVSNASAELIEQVLLAANVAAWVCGDDLCTSAEEVDVRPIACVLTDDCAPTSDDIAAHIGGHGALTLVFDAGPNGPVIVGLVVGEGDARADLDRARHTR